MSGMEYCLTADLTGDKRMADLKPKCSKGITSWPPGIQKNLGKRTHREVEYGHAVPVGKEAVFRLKDAMAQQA